MARTAEFVHIPLHELMLLLNYRWAASNSEIGDLGNKPYETLVAEINMQSKVELTAEQLADLIYHMKEVIFERVKPAPLALSLKNHNQVMRRLKSYVPNLFKETAQGEIVMVNYEDNV
jgi:hypothetical protein